MHEKRQNAGVADFDGRVLVVGGFDGMNFLDSIEILDMKVDTPSWVMSDIKLNTPTATLGCKVVDEEECTLLVVGGQTGTNTTKDIDAIDDTFIIDIDDKKTTFCKEVPRDIDNLTSGRIIRAGPHLFFAFASEGIFM